jgi:hypothetical protein
MTRRSLLSLISVPACLLLAGFLFNCAGAHGKAAALKSWPVPAASVALIEWQFPAETNSLLRVHPLQAEWLGTPSQAALWPALYPQISEASKVESSQSLKRLMKHGERCALAFMLNRKTFTPPFLINVSESTPAVVQNLISAGVRIFCFSIGGRGEDAKLLKWIDSMVQDHPEVLFIVSTPHISGNSIGVQELGEIPSVLATQGRKNVLLVGALRFYDQNIEQHRAGQILGTAANPFFIDNQPVDTHVQQVFIMNDLSTREFVEGFSGTSAAAPHLAGLLGLVAEHLVNQSKPVTADALLAELGRITHRTMAKEKSGVVHEISYFTLDTLLLNAGEPLLKKKIWGEFINESPTPLRISGTE